MSKEVKKIYRKQWLDFRIKKTLIISLLSALIINLLIFLIIGKNINDYYESSVINNTEIKYIIPSPSQSQIDELKNKEYVNNIVSSSFLKLNTNVRDNNIETPIVIIDEKLNLNNTPYSLDRKIKGANHLNDDTVFIDYLFSVKNNVKLNDVLDITIGNNKLTYKVSGIYETNTLVNSDYGSILLYKSNRLNDFLTDNNYNLKITNAYVNANKEIESDYFVDYKAYGRLKDRSEFPDDDSYQIHYDNFIKTNFTNEIVHFKIKAVNFNLPIYILIINSIILLLVSFYNYVFLNNKREDGFRIKMIRYGIVNSKTRKDEKARKAELALNEKKKKDNIMMIINHYKKSFYIELFLIVLFAIIPTGIYYLILRNSGLYIISIYKTIYILSIIVVVILSLVFNFLLINKINKKIKGL